MTNKTQAQLANLNKKSMSNFDMACHRNFPTGYSGDFKDLLIHSFCWLSSVWIILLVFQFQVFLVG